jgi:enamine deaminase RidA (YjgF/YER057c/UK114 family)
MPRTSRKPSNVHPPVGAYTHQVEIEDSSGKWLAIAGQLGRTVGGAVPEDPIEQIRLVFDNLKHNLEAAGMGVTDIVKWNWYLVGSVDPQKRREVTMEWLNGHEPASTLVYVAALAAPEYRVEIEAWAWRG